MAGRSLIRSAVPLLMLAAPLAGLACSPAIDAQLDEAQALVAEGRAVEALPLLQRVVQRRPNDGAANLLLGQVLLQTGRTRPAVARLTRALESERYAVPAGLLLASAYLGEGRPRNALTAIDRVLASHPDQPAALRIRATARLQSGNAEAALTDARRIIEVAPEDAQGPLLLGTALTRLGRLDEAEQVLVDLETSARSDPSRHSHACTALATFLSAGRHDTPRAATTWQSCLERHPTDPAVLHGATAFFDQSGRAATSLAALSRALELQPDALGLRLSVARRLAASGKPARGEALLADYAAAAERPERWQALSLFLAERGDPEAAQQSLDRALAIPGDHADALHFQKANLLVDLGRLADARTAHDAIQDAALRDLLGGRIHLAENDPVAAAEALDRAIEQRPRDARGHYLRGAAAQAQGDLDGALRSFAAALELDPAGTDAALAAARLHAAMGEHASAVSLLQRHRAARGSAKRESVLLEARATAALGQPDAAAALLERWLLGAGHDPEALALLADILAASKQPAAAVARIDRATALGLDLTVPAALPVLRAFGVHAAGSGQLQRSLGVVNRALTAHPDSAGLLVLKANYLEAAGRGADAEASLRRATELAPMDPAALIPLGRWLLVHERPEEALPVFERAHEAAPAQYEAGFQAARILSSLGRSEQAEARLRAVIAANALHAGACNDLAWLLAESDRDLDLALTLAQRAVRLQPGAATLDTLGWVQLQRGELDDAIDTLQQAVARMPADPGFHYRLGLAFDRAGRQSDARAAYQQALDRGAFPEAGAARTALERLGNGHS